VTLATGCWSPPAKTAFSKTSIISFPSSIEYAGRAAIDARLWRLLSLGW
jgi:hypothetical protein